VEFPSQLSKLRLVCGDVTKPGLGISETDLKILQDEVNVILHSAATVRFDEPLKLAVTINTLGTRRIIEFARSISHLHVSRHAQPRGNLPIRIEAAQTIKEHLYAGLLSQFFSLKTRLSA
jgi:thioester reductase-like protein